MRRFEVLELPQNDLRVVLMDAELDDRARRPESHGRELLRVQMGFRSSPVVAHARRRPLYIGDFRDLMAVERG